MCARVDVRVRFYDCGWVFFLSMSDLGSIFGDASALEVTIVEVLIRILTIKLNIFNSSFFL